MEWCLHLNVLGWGGFIKNHWSVPLVHDCWEDNISLCGSINRTRDDQPINIRVQHYKQYSSRNEKRATWINCVCCVRKPLHLYWHRTTKCPQSVSLYQTDRWYKSSCFRMNHLSDRNRHYVCSCRTPIVNTVVLNMQYYYCYHINLFTQVFFLNRI